MCKQTKLCPLAASEQSESHWTQTGQGKVLGLGLVNHRFPGNYLCRGTDAEPSKWLPDLIKAQPWQARAESKHLESVKGKKAEREIQNKLWVTQFEGRLYTFGVVLLLRNRMPLNDVSNVNCELRAKAAAESCRRWALRWLEPKGLVRRRQPSVAQICRSEEEDLLLVAQVPRRCPTLVAHCSLVAMQGLSQSRQDECKSARSGVKRLPADSSQQPADSCRRT